MYRENNYMFQMTLLWDKQYGNDSTYTLTDKYIDSTYHQI